MKYSLSAVLASVFLASGAYAAEPQAAAATPAPAPAPKEASPSAAPQPAPVSEAAKPALPAKDFTIIKLGSEEVKNSEAEEVWKGLFPGGNAPDFATFDENIRQNVLRGMVSEKLIYQQAVKEGFDKSDEVKKRLAGLEKQLILQSFMENKAKSLVTEQELKTAYAQKIGEMKGQEEIHARHILVGTEEEAKSIAKDMKKGGDFEKVAKEKSTDKGSGEQGGDLGWFTKDKMVPEFADAAFKLKKGEVSEPVKTQFGWHVIKVEDRRAVKPPAFEDMKEELQADASNKAVQAYVEDLLKKADIKYYSPDGKEREFSRSLAQAKK